ncbi:unnamed protein product [Scytosiphon promiscuus]
MLDTAVMTVVDQTAIDEGQGGEAAGHGCHFLRCTRDSSSSNSNRSIGHPSAGLLAELPKNLRDLLLCHPDSIANERPGANGGADDAVAPSRDLGGLVAGARTERRSVRRNRVGYLKASKAMACSLVTSQLNAVRQAAGSFREGCSESRGRLNSRLGSLVLRFAAATGAEMAAEDARMAAEGEHCRRETERLSLAARLATLSATVEHRTRGNVLLRRLPPTHPQHARCLRAATENVRPGFFSNDSPYGAVQVLDIYKIENRLLLERFQHAAEARGPRKVKGLFCHVPDESLEHTVLYGMGSAAPLVGDCDGSSSSYAASPADVNGFPSLHVWDGDLIDSFSGDGCATNNDGKRGRSESGVGSHGNRDIAEIDDSDARARPGGSVKRPLEFPRAFSRHSTLEEEHEYANTELRSLGDEKEVPHHVSRFSPAGEGSGHAAATSSPPEFSGAPVGAQRRRRPRAAGDGFAGSGQEGPAVSGLRFLALCRVMIGSMHVAPATARSPTAQGNRSNDGPGGTGSLPSQDSACPRSRTSSAAFTQQESHQQEQELAPLFSPAASEDRFSLPPPPPGHADFDAVYFPQEEEYRLLNKDFVLPEFLVVHRFVAAAKPPLSTRLRSSGSGPSSTPSSTDRVTDTDGASCPDDSARGDSAEARTGKWAAGGQTHERDKHYQQQQHHSRSDPPAGDVRRALEPPSACVTRAPQQDAASVVAGIEAAIEGISSAHVLSRASLGGGDGRSATPRRAAVAALSFTANDLRGGVSNASPSWYGTNDGRAGSLPPSPSHGSGDTGAMDGRSADCLKTEREGRNGRADRDAIVQDVKSEFGRYLQEMSRLREMEKDKVVLSSRTKLGHRR